MCVGGGCRKGARRTASFKIPGIKFIHSEPALEAGWGRGSAAVGSRRGRRAAPGRPPLEGCSGTRTRRARARAPAGPPARPAAPGAPRPRPACTRAGRETLSAGAPGPGGWGLGASQRDCRRRRRRAKPGAGRRRREQEAAAARPGPPAQSEATCTGHPRRGRQTAAKRRTPRLPRARARGGETRDDPAPPPYPRTRTPGGAVGGWAPRPPGPRRRAPTTWAQVRSGPRLLPLPLLPCSRRLCGLSPPRVRVSAPQPRPGGGLGVREFSTRSFLGLRPVQCFSHSDVPAA